MSKLKAVPFGEIPSLRREMRFIGDDQAINHQYGLLEASPIVDVIENAGSASGLYGGYAHAIASRWLYAGSRAGKCLCRSEAE